MNGKTLHFVWVLRHLTCPTEIEHGSYIDLRHKEIPYPILDNQMPVELAALTK